MECCSWGFGCGVLCWGSVLGHLARGACGPGGGGPGGPGLVGSAARLTCLLSIGSLRWALRVWLLSVFLAGAVSFGLGGGASSWALCLGRGAASVGGGGSVIVLRSAEVGVALTAVLGPFPVRAGGERWSLG